MTTISTITPLSPNVPSTSNPDKFDEYGDKLLSELPTMVTEENTSIGQMNTVAEEVSANKTAAETARDKSEEWAEKAEDSEVETGKYSALHHSAKAKDAQTAAENASNATLYDSGITGGYGVGDVVYSTAGDSYRCIQVQAEGAVEALTNELYWTWLGGESDPLPDIFMMGF